ncbi:MAG: hypothetical protein JWO46_695 [Nocardioidaceae bacterium]|nr:hypothetical protein [Nocardioidaceae bacterium]
MRAVLFDEYGEPDVLHLGETVEPHAGAGQVRIAVEAAGVNGWDWKVRSGAMAQMMPVQLPAVPGIEAAGVVDEVGPGVEGVAIGDRVFGGGTATTAEHAVLHAFAPVPSGLSTAEAAALPVAVETSARVLGLLDLEPGQWLVVDGAAGGVGTTLVQLAVARGLRVVGTASEGNHAFLRELGAVPTTYGAWLPDRVSAIVDGPVSGGLDLVGKGSVADLIAITGDPGRVVSIADFGAPELGARVSDGSEGRAWDALAEVGSLVEADRFRVVVGEVLPWTEAARAHALSQSGHARGKLVLSVG